MFKPYFKLYFVAGVILIMLLIIGLFGYRTYQALEAVPPDSPRGEFTFQVSKDDTLNDIAVKLEEQKVINSAQGLILREKINPIGPLQQGQYKLTLPASPIQILKQIEDNSAEIRENLEKQSKVPSVKLTFQEGWTLDQYIDKLDKEGVANRDELVKFAQDPKNFDTVKYDFLPRPLNCTYGDLKNCPKYYPEGYLYPDTYNFFKPTAPKDVFDKFLTNFNRKVWSKYKSNLNGQNFEQIMILASVIEKESGRTKGVTPANKDDLQKERHIISGVFNNRLRRQLKWQSNPTVEYGQDHILCEQTFKRPGCKFLDDPAFVHKYNTYISVGYPIGPISNPQADCIDAALNPEQTDYLYFLADATGKTYFATNETEFNKLINEVTKINQTLGVAT
jgi:UPF0755 protein